jgi:hypothetical protein
MGKRASLKIGSSLCIFSSLHKPSDIYIIFISIIQDEPLFHSYHIISHQIHYYIVLNLSSIIIMREVINTRCFYLIIFKYTVLNLTAVYRPICEML